MCSFVLASLLTTATGIAQPHDLVRPRETATVEGFVFDSLSGTPLSGAIVQLTRYEDPAAFSRVADSDSAGRFVFRSVPRGRYLVGYHHPLLDSLGVAAPVKDLRVRDESQSYGVELAVPSVGTVLSAICGVDYAQDSSAAIVGYVRDPDDASAVAGAVVRGAWLEVTIGVGGIHRRSEAVSTTSAPNGWFALCDLPRGVVSVSLVATGDSVTLAELTVPEDGLLRRDFFIPRPSTAPLSGKVVTADSGRSVPGAIVSADGVDPTRTDGQGQWALRVPLGTRQLVVRAIGYTPRRMLVDVRRNSVPQLVVLENSRVLIDPVRVTATPLDGVDLGGFVRRRRGSGIGRYLSADDIARRNPMLTTDLFRSMPGFTNGIFMRSPFSDGAGGYAVDCMPSIYLDGHPMPGVDLNAMVWPEHIAALEVYSAGSPKPPQFDRGMSGCGSIVIWLKPLKERVRGR